MDDLTTQRQAYLSQRAMAHGLKREQVAAPNFEHYTIDAIKDIMKRTKVVSVNKAFKMIAGKSRKDVLQKPLMRHLILVYSQLIGLDYLVLQSI